MHILGVTVTVEVVVVVVVVVVVDVVATVVVVVAVVVVVDVVVSVAVTLVVSVEVTESVDVAVTELEIIHQYSSSERVPTVKILGLFQTYIVVVAVTDVYVVAEILLVVEGVVVTVVVVGFSRQLQTDLTKADAWPLRLVSFDAIGSFVAVRFCGLGEEVTVVVVVAVIVSVAV